MEEIISFIVSHWRLIAECCCAICALVLFIVKKKPVDVVDGLYSALVKAIPGFIVFAEQEVGAGKGDVKLQVVINLATAFINKLYPGLKDLSPYIEFVKNQVEVILSTPQKKGE